MRFLITNYNNNYSTRAASNTIFVLSMPNCEIYKRLLDTMLLICGILCLKTLNYVKYC